MKDKLYEQLKSELKYMIKTFGIIAISQYILNQENVKEDFQRHVNIDKNSSMENEYNQVMTENELFSKDIDIINMLYDKMHEIDYDEENHENCAKAVYSVAAFLKTNLVRTETTWNQMKRIIIDILRQMNTRDFLTTLEIAGMKEAYELEEVMAEIKIRIPQMTECEFLRFHTDIINYDVKIDDELDLLISKKVDKASKVLAPKYIAMSNNPLDVALMLDKVENPEKIEAIIKSLNCWDEEIDERIESLVESLSDEQLIRFIGAISNFKYENEKLDNVLLRRMKLLSKEDLEMVVAVYLISPRIEMSDKIMGIAIEKGVMYKNEVDERGIMTDNGRIEFSRRQIYDDMDFGKRVSMYQKFKEPITNLMTVMCHDNLNYALMVLGNTEGNEESVEQAEREIDDIFLQKYEELNEIIEISEEMIEYIKYLSQMDDKSIVKIIGVIAKKMANMEESSEIEQTQVNEFREKAYDLTEKYLVNRILELQDRGAILLLSTLYNMTCHDTFNHAIAVKVTQCMDQIKLEVPSDGER